jgi:hypothetical protein
LSFEKFLEGDMEAKDFGSKRYSKVFKEVHITMTPLIRQHVSKVKVDEHRKAKYLSIGEVYGGVYDSRLGVRYLVFSPMVFDAMLSVYDSNTGSMMAYRWYKFEAKQKADLEKRIAQLRRKGPNLEARLIGMQNGQPTADIKEAVAFLKAQKLPLVEIDLFGSEIRHIAIDHKLGSSLNMLVENRLYRPGELANMQTMEQFERSVMPVVVTTPQKEQRK